MRIGVTGSTGMLGTEVVNAVNNASHEAVEFSRNELSDITSLQETVRLLSSLNIDVLVHCAANTNVELCEVEPESCWLQNCLFTEILAIATVKLGIKFVYISSTGIYGTAKSTPYIEYDDVIPTTVHHSSKYIAENIVKGFCKDYLIIRTGWLFGGNWHSKKNFIANRIKEAKASEGIIYSNKNQIGNPTYAKDVASTIIQLITFGYRGLYNCVSEGVASRHEYVTEIFKIAQLNVSVLSASKESFNRLARVSDNESAENFKLKALNLGKARAWQKALEEYIMENKANL